MSVLPERCGVALKEWAGVCAALAQGRQTVLLRKGGIREQAGRFVPEHPCFWLYPTHVHEAQQGLRDEALAPAASFGGADESIPIDGLALIEWTEFVTSENALPALEPFHVWTAETIHKRFHYRRPGLWAIGVRVFRRDERWSLVPTPEQLGCVSWVILDRAVETEGARAVLDDETASERAESARAALAGRQGTGS